MVEITGVTAREGIQGCLRTVADVKNAPTYVGIAVGAMGGNVAAGITENMYLKTLGPNDVGQYLARTTGRLAASAVMCAVSGSFTGDMAEVLESGAVGSAGMVVVDGLKTFAPAPIGGAGGYADLQFIHARKPLGAPAALQVPARVVPTTMPTGGLVGGKPQMAEQATFVSGK